jgi:hypothetical protein
MLAASLGLGVMAGGALAARPGGPLYDARLWAETLTLPSDPSARAVAELDRLKDRLREIAEASRAGDSAGAAAALAAYGAIVEEASASAILAGDDVAAAVLEAGVGRNVVVLQALVAKVPANASAAISGALDAAIVRSSEAVERIHASRGGGGPDNGGGSGPPAAEPTPNATKAPTADPADAATSKPKPTHKATAVPTPRPERTPKPHPGGAPDPSKPSKPGQDGRDTHGNQSNPGGG